MSESLLIPARHQPCAGWTADRGRRVRISETDTSFGKSVEMRRLNVCRTLKSKITVTQIIGEDEQNVGFLLFGSEADVEHQCERKERLVTDAIRDGV